MEDKRVTESELEAALQGDFKQLVAEIAAAMNAAKPGRIIADSEEPVRDANAEFRQRAYQKAIDLLQSKQEAFPPSGQWVPAMEEQGPTENDVPDR
jgi:TolA-binding protein